MPSGQTWSRYCRWLGREAQAQMDDATDRERDLLHAALGLPLGHSSPGSAAIGGWRATSRRPLHPPRRSSTPPPLCSSSDGSDVADQNRNGLLGARSFPRSSLMRGGQAQLLASQRPKSFLTARPIRRLRQLAHDPLLEHHLRLVASGLRRQRRGVARGSDNRLVTHPSRQLGQRPLGDDPGDGLAAPRPHLRGGGSPASRDPPDPCR